MVSRYTNNVEWVFITKFKTFFDIHRRCVNITCKVLLRLFLVSKWALKSPTSFPRLEFIANDLCFNSGLIKFLIYLTSSSNIVSGLTLCQLLMRSNMSFLFWWSRCSWHCRTSAIDDLRWPFNFAFCFWTKMSNSLFICSARTSWWNPLKGILPNRMNSSVTPKLQMSAGLGRNGFCERTSGGR